MLQRKENQLLTLTNKELTITSVELVDIINKLREEERTLGLSGKLQRPLLHKNFMAKIRKEVEVMETLGLSNGINFKPVEYRDAKGEIRPCFSLNRDGALQMLNAESTYVRAKTIEYINMLEKELKDARYVSDSDTKKVLAGELIFSGTNPIALSQLVQLTERSINGKDMALTVTQLVDRLSIPRLTSTLFNNYLCDRGLGEYVRFGKEKNKVFQPNENWYEFFCADGMSLTGKTSTGKVKVEYTPKMVEIINKHYREDLIRYVQMMVVA